MGPISGCISSNVRRFVVPSLAVLVGLVIGLRATTAVGDDKPEGPEPSEALRTMTAIARGVQMTMQVGGASQRIEPFDEPIYRYTDPARAFSDGSVWAFGKTGRPSALVTIAPQRNNGRVIWLCELTSLADGPIMGVVPGSQPWTPSRGSEIKFQPVADAPAPAGDEAARLRQMKALTRRMKAFEFYTPRGQADPERYELRLLPQPFARYSDPKSSIVDGAMFLFVYGNNPEIVLLLEARRDSRSAPAWTYGFTRIAAAELHVNDGSREVWTAPRSVIPSPENPYWAVIRSDAGSAP